MTNFPIVLLLWLDCPFVTDRDLPWTFVKFQERHLLIGDFVVDYPHVTVLNGLELGYVYSLFVGWTSSVEPLYLPQFTCARSSGGLEGEAYLLLLLWAGFWNSVVVVLLMMMTVVIRARQGQETYYWDLIIIFIVLPVFVNSPL